MYLLNEITSLRVNEFTRTVGAKDKANRKKKLLTVAGGIAATGLLGALAYKNKDKLKALVTKPPKIISKKAQNTAKVKDRLQKIQTQADKYMFDDLDITKKPKGFFERSNKKSVVKVVVDKLRKNNDYFKSVTELSLFARKLGSKDKKQRKLKNLSLLGAGLLSGSALSQLGVKAKINKNLENAGLTKSQIKSKISSITKETANRYKNELRPNAETINNLNKNIIRDATSNGVLDINHITNATNSKQYWTKKLKDYGKATATNRQTLRKELTQEASTLAKNTRLKRLGIGALAGLGVGTGAVIGAGILYKKGRKDKSIKNKKDNKK